MNAWENFYRNGGPLMPGSQQEMPRGIQNQYLAQLEQHVNKRTGELLKGMYPEFNAAPTMDLVRQAYLMGYDIVPLGKRPTDGV